MHSSSYYQIRVDIPPPKKNPPRILTIVSHRKKQHGDSNIHGGGGTKEKQDGQDPLLCILLPPLLKRETQWSSSWSCCRNKASHRLLIYNIHINIVYISIKAHRCKTTKQNPQVKSNYNPGLPIPRHNFYRLGQDSPDDLSPLLIDIEKCHL